MRFTKMHGLGNDFLVVDEVDARGVDWSRAAPLLCDRRRGVGADGVLLVEPSRHADLRMRVVNADGSEAETCGNGVRCLAVHVAARRRAGAAVTWETGAGLVRTEVVGDGAVRVEMGVPGWRPAEVPVLAAGDDALDVVLDLGPDVGSAVRRVRVSAVSMGNPHCVVTLDGLEPAGAAPADLDDLDIGVLGPALEGHARFPKRANVEFVQVLSRTAVRQRTFERGVGETDACGSGACAAVAALLRRGLLDAAVDVHLRGGTLRVEWDGAGPVWMTGPAVTVYEGHIEVPAGPGPG